MIALFYWLAAERTLTSDRVVLVGVGVSGAAATAALVVVVISPCNTGAALTWLAGSTYGRTTGPLPTITSAGKRNPAKADWGNGQGRDRAACFTGQACLDLPASET